MHYAIKVDDLSKAYRLGVREAATPTITGALISLAKSPLRNFHRLRRLNTYGLAADGRHDADDMIWALKNVSFEVKEGEVVGVIGGNGAGKSTLLKLLSQITEPTAGRAEIRGRVSSLLEVGTGFHPELSGRDNIYMNGTILGMRKKEIDRKFDEIVDFSGVEKFLDTPVKRYSSGMKVRLAFSVAAHLEPEILIIDEVLAVGDAEFQKKCLGKMDRVAHDGRTVLFVSHNMAAVQNLCQRGIVLAGGRVVTDAPVSQAVAAYFARAASASANSRLDQLPRMAHHRPIFTCARLLNSEGAETGSIPACDSLTIELEFASDAPIARPGFGIHFESATGERVFALESLQQHPDFGAAPARGAMRCHIPCVPLAPGEYYLTLRCTTGTHNIDRLPRALQLTVTEADVFGTGRLPPASKGHVLVRADWRLEDSGSDEGGGGFEPGQLSAPAHSR
jgi:lipopolysaccharide transport system ATP-binding protein